MQKSQTREAAHRIFRNSLALIGGKAYGGLLSLFYMGVAARSLGPEEMGYLVLAHAYVLFISYIARFQSWQAVIRFGAPLVAADEKTTFGALIRFTVRLDILSAIVAVAVSVGLLGLVTDLMGWPEHAQRFIFIYCLTAPFLISATPTGVLRLFDRFNLLSRQLMITPSVRLIGALALWLTDGGLNGFLIVWIVSVVLDGIVLWWLGWRELKQRNLLPVLGVTQKAAPDWLPFMIKTNLSSTIDQSQSKLPVLIVGAVLGGAEAGFLQLAVNLSNLIAQPASMLNHATYPELSKVYTEQGESAMRKVTGRSIRTALMIAAPIVVIFNLFGEEIAILIAGSEFAPAGVLIGLMALTQLWRITSLICESTLLALGRAGYILLAQSAAAIINVSTLWICIPILGMVSAPVAIIVGWTTLIAAYLQPLVFRPASSPT